jgi:cytochrome b6-f complex iron-sulfur subunit
MTDVIEPIPNSRRQFLTLLTTGAVGASVAGALYPAVNFFIPPGSGSADAGVVARDRLGKAVSVKALLADNAAGMRVIAQGLSTGAGTATYILIDENKKIEAHGLNAVCPHLGCVVPWESGINQFKCPCHGSGYDKDGGLIHGPSGKPLPLVKAAVKDDTVALTPWTEDDFRKTELYSDPKPWWV